MAAVGDWQDRLRKLFTVSLSELNPLRSEEHYLGIDIGSSAVKVIETRASGDRVVVDGWGCAPTPAEAIQSNMVAQPEQVAGVIRGLIDAKGLHGRHVVTAVPGPAVMIKRVTLPAQSQRDLENTVLFEAGNFIPEDLENVNLDFQIIGHLEATNQIEVLLVAAKKEIVESYSETLRMAGLLPAVVDVDYFALDNMYELTPNPAAQQVVALVNIGSRYSSINILKNGVSTFTGDVPVGGRDVTEALSRDLGVPTEQAERLKSGETVDGVDTEQLSMALGPAMDALIEEIHYALSFFWTAATDEKVDVLCLSGGAAQMSELGQRLTERAEAPVQIADPLAGVIMGDIPDIDELRRRAPEFAVAVGLAVRRVNDK